MFTTYRRREWVGRSTAAPTERATDAARPPGGRRLAVRPVPMISRHSAASLLIAEGVELVEVSMLLGHSELRVTGDLYSHLQKQTASKAARTDGCRPWDKKNSSRSPCRWVLRRRAFFSRQSQPWQVWRKGDAPVQVEGPMSVRNPWDSERPGVEIAVPRQNLKPPVVKAAPIA